MRFGLRGGQKYEVVRSLSDEESRKSNESGNRAICEARRRPLGHLCVVISYTLGIEFTYIIQMTG